MDAMITAGGITLPNDPLYILTGLKKKALIPLAGRPMISWVVEALWKSELVENLVIIGLKPGEVSLDGIPVHFVDAVGGLVDNVLAGLDRLRQANPATKKILLFSSDIPLITPEVVRGFVEECGRQDADGYYAVVEEKTMEARFPGSKRMFVPFRGGRYSGGDAFLIDVVATKGNVPLFRALTNSRKNYWQQARMLGFTFIVKFLLRRMTVYEAAERGNKALNLNARVIATRFAELGMDLDKPRHYDIIKAELEKREATLFTG